MGSSNSDELLGALDQLTNALHWYRDRDPSLTAADALIEAVDDWLAEHHQSTPYRPVTHGNEQADHLGVLLDVLQTATHALDGPGGRPGVTFTAALTEAIEDWIATSAAEHHASAPFDMALWLGHYWLAAIACPAGWLDGSTAVGMAGPADRHLEMPARSGRRHDDRLGSKAGPVGSPNSVSVPARRGEPAGTLRLGRCERRADDIERMPGGRAPRRCHTSRQILPFGRGHDEWR